MTQDVLFSYVNLLIYSALITSPFQAMILQDAEIESCRIIVLIFKFSAPRVPVDTSARCKCIPQGSTL